MRQRFLGSLAFVLLTVSVLPTLTGLVKVATGAVVRRALERWDELHAGQ